MRAAAEGSRTEPCVLTQVQEHAISDAGLPAKHVLPRDLLMTNAGVSVASHGVTAYGVGGGGRERALSSTARASGGQALLLDVFQFKAVHEGAMQRTAAAPRMYFTETSRQL